MTRSDLETWQARMVHIVMRHVQMSYNMHGFNDVAPFKGSELEPFLKDGISDACGKAWAALEPMAWMNEPGDGARSDELYDEPRGVILR